MISFRYKNRSFHAQHINIVQDANKQIRSKLVVVILRTDFLLDVSASMHIVPNNKSAGFVLSGVFYNQHAGL